MALIIEDGTLVVGANSYVTVDEAIAYATSRREAFPTDPDEVESLLHKAMDYIEAQRRRFSGTKTSIYQDTQYPRISSKVDGVVIGFDVIPRELKLAQCQLAVDCYALGDLSPTSSGYAVSKEKVDVIEVQYAAGSTMSGGATAAEPSFPKADAFLECMYGDFSWLRTVRA